MAELTILDNADVEMAVIIDTETYTALPIVAVGPDRVTYLQGFIDSVPFDLTMLNADTLREGFVQFLQTHGALPNTEAESTAIDSVGTASRDGDDAESALAEREAINATDTPAPQPADDDAEEAPRTVTRKVKCWNCNGEGTIEFGDGTAAVTCNMCHGRQWIEEEVPA